MALPGRCRRSPHNTIIIIIIICSRKHATRTHAQKHVAMHTRRAIPITDGRHAHARPPFHDLSYGRAANVAPVSARRRSGAGYAGMPVCSVVVPGVPRQHRRPYNSCRSWLNAAHGFPRACVCLHRAACRTLYCYYCRRRRRWGDFERCTHYLRPKFVSKISIIHLRPQKIK